jgi:hypothetical protein
MVWAEAGNGDGVTRYRIGRDQYRDRARISVAGYLAEERFGLGEDLDCAESDISDLIEASKAGSFRPTDVETEVYNKLEDPAVMLAMAEIKRKLILNRRLSGRSLDSLCEFAGLQRGEWKYAGRV